MHSKFAGVLAVVAAASAARGQNQVSFTIEPIALNGFPLSYTAGVNDAGQVACGTTDSFSAGDASRWAAGIAVPLPAPSGWTPGRIEAVGISSSGDVAGNLLVGSRHHGVRWIGGVGTVLPATGFASARAFDIGASGRIAGSVETSSGVLQACRWTSNDTLQVLPFPVGATRAQATAIRDDGAVAGMFGVAGTWGVCEWDAQGQIRIALQPQTSSIPLPTVLAADGSIHGTLQLLTGSWSPYSLVGGNLAVLPTFSPQGSGAVHDANAYGWLVGAASDSVDWKATVWIGQVPIDLNTTLVGGSGWTLGAALGVSDDGLICGIGTYQGAASAFLLRPSEIVLPYCTATTSSNGCTAAISAVGTPTATASSGFTLNVSGVDGQRSGMFFYGISGPTVTPWGSGNGTLCVKAPTQRTPLGWSGGTFGSCDGALALDWSAFMSTHPAALGNPRVPGEHVQTQAWYRDPPSPKLTSLSNALEFLLVP